MPWLDGSFQGNGFLYDATWGGLVTLQGLTDFGFGIYNDHHHHLCYFLYTIAVLARLDRKTGVGLRLLRGRGAAELGGRAR